MSAAPTAIVIREIQTLSELTEVEDLQKEIWRVTDREILPALAMIPMKEVGGVLLGAFDAGKLIGFSFAFPGIENGKPILHSDMLAVKPDYRSLGLGLQLKLAQRTHALDKGINTITWTFDPLQALNANLNFGKLGVVSDHYHVNYYGETTSFLHSTGTDRLWVTWKLDSEWVKERIEQRRSAVIAEEPGSVILRVGEDGEPVISEHQNVARLWLEIPGDFNRLVQENIELAVRWREATREVFTSAIPAGYLVKDFEFARSAERNFGRYLLTSDTL
ncbi:MAG TPA: GNAT family N-acetyltransferase [Pyrinomonadaceae bacterium]